MANNRMWIVHRPSGLAVYVAKRMGWGWYSPNKDFEKDMTMLLSALDEQAYCGDQDAFSIIHEEDGTDWQYGAVIRSSDNGYVRQITFGKDKPIAAPKE